MRERFAYLHVPKAAGRAVTDALHAVVAPERRCPTAMDRTLFGGFTAFAELGPGQRAQVFVGDPAELAGYDVVIGHYALPTLTSAFSPGDVAMLLREPRARLLSLYTYWRGWAPERHDTWRPYAASRTAAELDWPAFLAEPSIAAQTDNVVTRLLVGADDRIPPDAFIAPEHLDELVEVAQHRIGQLGHVDVIEHGPVCWARLGNWVGTELDVVTRNATTDAARLVTDWDRWLAAGSDALRHRTAGDAAVWASAAARFAAAGFETLAATTRLADETFARQTTRIREVPAAPPTTDAERPRPTDTEQADAQADVAAGDGAVTALQWRHVAALEPIWLNLGGRLNHHPAPGYEGYVAVDLMPPGDGWAVAHDLRHPIPLPDGSVDRIITEDFLEHLPAEMLPPLLADCHRLLAPGGTMRIAVPDYNNPKDRYAFDGMAHDRRNPEHITRTDRFMVERLLAASPFTDYRFVQYWDGDRFVEHPLDDSLGPVKRCPQHDPRCRRDGWRAKLRGAVGDVGSLLRAGRRARIGELRSRPGNRWYVTSLIVDITR